MDKEVGIALIFKEWYKGADSSKIKRESVYLVTRDTWSEVAYQVAFFESGNWYDDNKGGILDDVSWYAELPHEVEDETGGS